MDLTVSVIIPTFNRREALMRAVRSCLEQTHPVTEILVCDDGSTDGSRESIVALASDRVRWVEGERAGRPAPARNRGLRAARGEWMAFLDDDDAWFPEKLAVQFARLASSGTYAVCTNAERIVPGAGSKGTYFNHASKLLSFVDLLAENKVISSSLLAKKELLMKAGGFPEAPEFVAIEDYALWLRLSVFTDIFYCEDPLVAYTDSATTTLRAKQTSASHIRNVVLSDLHAWMRTRPGSLTPPQRSALVRHLRIAKRGVGSPPWEWLFIR